MPRNRHDPLRGNAHKFRAETEEEVVAPEQLSKCDLYFIRMEDSLGPIKIGKSLTSRQRQRILQCGSPYPLSLVGILFCEGVHEPAWHRHFADLKMLGEWFRPSPELDEAIAVAVKEGSRKALRLPDPPDPPSLPDWRAACGLPPLNNGGRCV